MNISNRIIIIISLFITCLLVRSDANAVLKKDTRKSSSSVLAEIAQQLFQKSKGNHIININLSALLLLILLKAAAIGAGLIGNYDYYKSPRINEENIVSTDEITLALGYLIGDTCLYRAACEVPNTAKEYLGAIDVMMEAMKLMPQKFKIDEYEKRITEFRRAIKSGELEQCPSEYTCKEENINNFLKFE